MIDTPLIYKQISSQYSSVEDMVAARNAAVPVGRMGDAFDIARAAVFLASDEAKFITGICLPVETAGKVVLWELFLIWGRQSSRLKVI